MFESCRAHHKKQQFTRFLVVKLVDLTATLTATATVSSCSVGAKVSEPNSIKANTRTLLGDQAREAKPCVFICDKL